jgi:hypothetical protein
MESPKAVIIKGPAIGLMEQLRPENRRTYDTSKWPWDAKKMLAHNTCHLLTQEGAITFQESLRLYEMIESPDYENLIVAVSIMEEKLKPTQDVSHIQITEPQV